MTLQTLVRPIIITLFFSLSLILLIAPELLLTPGVPVSETRHLLIAGTGIVLYGLDDYISRWNLRDSNETSLCPRPCNCN